MTLYVPTGTAPLSTRVLAQIDRRLLYPGEVLVRIGQRVEPEDIVAQAYRPVTPQIINVARVLMIAPSQVPQAMRREVGNKVAQGEVLARTSRFGGRSCLAPVSGVIAAVDRETGYVTISPDPELHAVQATVRGVVMELFPGEGVRIETPAAQVYGAFGIGVERAGVLRLLVTDASEPIVPEMIDARSSYAIVIGGSSISAAALRRAVQEQVRGIIVGGIDEQELRSFLGANTHACWRLDSATWQLLPVRPGTADELTIVVTEGFGSRPMAAPLFELLAEHDRQEALIAGTTRLRGPQTRPRVVIPLSSRGVSMPIEPVRPVLRPGAVVRLLDDEYLGQIGQVRAVAPLRYLGSRVRAAVVEVLLEDGRTVLVSRPAVEVLN